MITSERLLALMYDLPALVKETRHRRGLSMEKAAKEIGISQSTVHRIEHGLNCDVYVLIKVLQWGAR